jgi:hypothetical protein
VSSVEVVAVPAQSSTPQPPRLHSPRTEQSHVDWAVRFNCFHSMQHPNTMGVASLPALVHECIHANTQVA